MILLKLLIFAVIQDLTFALLAYDCEDPDNPHVVYDATNPDLCADIEEQYRDPVTIKIQVISVNHIQDVPVKSCSVHVTRKISYCGFDSISYGSRWIDFERSTPIQPSECRKAHERGSIFVEGITIPIQKGMTVAWSGFTQGSISSTGYCDYRTYQRDGILYKNVVEESSFSVYSGIYKAKAYPMENTLVINNDLKLPYADTIAVDSSYGTLVWTKNEIGCHEEYSTIYSGSARIYKPNDAKLYDEIILVEDAGEDQFAGFVVKKAVSVCGYKVYPTQIKGIYVLILDDLEAPLARFNSSSVQVDYSSEYRSQLGYVFLSHQFQLHQKFRKVADSMCLLDRKVLNTQLASIRDRPSGSMVTAMWGVGHKAVVSGAALYVFTCKAVEVNRRDIQNCTNEIPVYNNGTALFMDPVSRELMPEGNIVPCDPISPVMWKINERWYCSNPLITRCATPETLKPSDPNSLVPGISTKGLTSGVFSESQMQDHVNKMRYGSTREAILSNLTTSVMINRGNGYSPNPILSEGDVNWITHQVGRAISPFFSVLGDFFSTIVGLLLVVSAVKYTCGVILRTVIVYRAKGCSVMMLASIWGTLFAIIMIPWRLIHTVVDQTVKEPEHEIQPLAPPEQVSSSEAPPQRPIISYSGLYPDIPR